MHISRVQVRNFRNFKDLEINPFPRSAVIVGENGVGKSNLLHALRLVLDPDLPNSARLLRPEDVCDFADRTLEDGVEIRVEVEITGFAGGTPPRKPSSKTSSSASNRLPPGSLTYSVLA